MEPNRRPSLHLHFSRMLVPFQRWGARYIAAVSVGMFFLAAPFIVGDSAYAASADPTPERRLADIEWPTTPEARAGQPSLSAAVQAKVDVARLPVLMPRSVASLKSFRFQGEENVYSATAILRGAKVVVIGTRHVVDAPRESTMRLRKPVDEEFTFAQREAGIDVTFTRYGAAYSISIECLSATDKRCASEEYARALANGMILIGGRP